MPSHLALSPDGSVWMTDEYLGVTRLRPNGDTTDYLTHDLFVADVAVTPDASAWSFSEAVPGLRGYTPFGDSDSLTVRDLDGDGEPEVTLSLNSNGNRCRSWSRIYRYDAARGTYLAHSHFWGSFVPALRDLNGDRRPEFVTRDYRFNERFTSSAESVGPLQIWSYRHGKLRDVTRRYPRLFRRDAAGIWRLYLQNRKDDVRGILPAWVADEYLLGRAELADRVLEHSAARGELRRRGGFGPRDPRAYIRAVKALLRRTGYSRRR
jgi:hypothetical protein